MAAERAKSGKPDLAKPPVQRCMDRGAVEVADRQKKPTLSEWVFLLCSRNMKIKNLSKKIKIYPFFTDMKQRIICLEEECAFEQDYALHNAVNIFAGNGSLKPVQVSMKRYTYVYI